MTTDLLTQLKLAGLPEPEPEHKFCPGRRWRFDWAYVERKIAIEREGGIWIHGRHNRPRGYRNDCEKYSEAAVLGWRILRFTPDMIASGLAVDMVRRALTQGEPS